MKTPGHTNFIKHIFLAIQTRYAGGMHYAAAAYPMPVALVGSKTRQAAFQRGTEAELTATAGLIFQCSMCSILH